MYFHKTTGSLVDKTTQHFSAFGDETVSDRQLTLQHPTSATYILLLPLLLFNSFKTTQGHVRCKNRNADPPSIDHRGSAFPDLWRGQDHDALQIVKLCKRTVGGKWFSD